jgi:hypothetical protein
LGRFIPLLSVALPASPHWPATGERARLATGEDCFDDIGSEIAERDAVGQRRPATAEPRCRLGDRRIADRLNPLAGRNRIGDQLYETGIAAGRGARSRRMIEQAIVAAASAV